MLSTTDTWSRYCDSATSWRSTASSPRSTAVRAPQTQLKAEH